MNTEGESSIGGMKSIWKILSDWLGSGSSFYRRLHFSNRFINLFHLQEEERRLNSNLAPYIIVGGPVSSHVSLLRLNPMISLLVSSQYQIRNFYELNLSHRVLPFVSMLRTHHPHLCVYNNCFCVSGSVTQIQN